MKSRNLLASAAALCAVSASAYAQQYEITDLGALPGGERSWAWAINDAGRIVGISEITPVESHAFMWENGQLRDLGQFPDSLGRTNDSYGLALNELGDVVGAGWQTEGFSALIKAFYLESGQTDFIDITGAAISSRATGVNDNRIVVGAGGLAGGQIIEGNLPERAFYWNGQNVFELPNLGGRNSGATAVNDQLDIVGYSWTADGAVRAFLFDSSSVLHDLGTLGGANSHATAVNESTQIAGWSEVPGGARRAFLWSAGAMTDLGTLGGASQATDLNDLGQVVGFSWTAAGTVRAFHYTASQGMTDLNDLAPSGWTLQYARAINNAGQIVGYGVNPQGVTRGFLLTPSCAPDWNGDGVVDSDDLFDFLADWAAGSADYNGDGVTDSDDLFEFLSDWAQGC